MSVLVRVLYISTSIDPLPHLSIWLGKRWEKEKKELKISNKDIKGKRSRHKVGKLGLNLQAYIKENEIVWFLVNLIY